MAVDLPRSTHDERPLRDRSRRMVEDLQRQGWSRSEIDRMVRFTRDANEPVLDGLRGGRLQ